VTSKSFCAPPATLEPRRRHRLNRPVSPLGTVAYAPGSLAIVLASQPMIIGVTSPSFSAVQWPASNSREFPARRN
jgi:hypothetical protein